jgi:hypothetical protein
LAERRKWAGQRTFPAPAGGMVAPIPAFGSSGAIRPGTRRPISNVVEFSVTKPDLVSETHRRRQITDLLLSEIGLGFRDFGGFAVCMTLEEDELLVVRFCRSRVSRGGGGLSGTVYTSEAIRVCRKRLLVSFQGLRGSIEL